MTRLWHPSRGDPCELCKRPALEHPSPGQIAKRKTYDKKRTNRQGKRVIIGIDGEGMDLPDGRHIYTLLCAVDETGRLVAEVENQNGLSALECFDMLLKLPRNSLKFVFMGSYDWTKIIEELDPLDIYYIMHPDTRREKWCSECKKKVVHNEPSCSCEAKIRSYQKLQKIKINNRHIALDWFNGSFTVAEGRLKRGFKRRTKVWDVFKFFQCSFVKAIKQWKVGTDEQIERIEKMKEKRGDFDKESPEDIRKYCREECHLLAFMMRQVLNACVAAGINLVRFEGAGSIAGALLKKAKVKDCIYEPTEHKGLMRAIMSAYFGGRFENSVVGLIEEPVRARDIYSAYPYAMFALPCLSCGRWRHVKKDVLRQVRKGTLALVRFKVKSLHNRDGFAWAPFPCRTKEGSICFPTGFTGWAWLPEFEAGLAGWPDMVEPLEAWIYDTDCEHDPFKWIPELYRRRFEWGKDGRGIVVKLGLNACAGKTMQNEGDPPPYKSWIWGGMITATTRAQALEGICKAKNRWNVLAIATDGLFTTEELELPKPEYQTGTEDLPKPLGHWGLDTYEKGVFFVKPGMYFDDTAELMRARGVGRKELKTSRQTLADAFLSWDRESELKIRVNSRRFFGARSSVLMFAGCDECKRKWPGVALKGCPSCGKVGNIINTTMMKLKDTQIPAYGRWAERDIDIEFACLPKREYIEKGGSYGRMRIRDMGDVESVPYEPGRTTPEGLQARDARNEALEEPDWYDTEI